MIRFYAPDVETSGVLPDTESAHACRVLRLREGDTLHVVDGKGHAFLCRISDANPKKTGVEVIEKQDEPCPWRQSITLAIAPTKNADRMEWLVEKAVEMGVDRIVLLECRHSEKRVYKLDRLIRIAVSAMKQSLKATLPEIVGMVRFSEFIENLPGGVRYIGYCDDAYPRKEFEKEYDGMRDITILIGPEGDFSPEEVAEAVRNGFLPVTFGNVRLRTETAGLYAVAATHALSNRVS